MIDASDTLRPPPPDTLPPGVEERPSLEPLLTERRFVELLREMVGDRLVAIDSQLRELRVELRELREQDMRLHFRQQEQEQRIVALERRLTHLEAQIDGAPRT